MTPQSSFMVVAPIDRGCEEALRTLLVGMNVAPGRVDPLNALVPFGAFDRIHFARLVILDDRTEGDIAVYRRPVEHHPTALAFLVDCDGPFDACIEDLATRAKEGLHRIFSYCGLSADENLAVWMRAHNHPAAAAYVNQPGRSVRSCREDAALCCAIDAFLGARHAEWIARGAVEIHAAVRAHVMEQVRDGHLTLTPDAATPLGWRIRNALHLISVPLALLLLLPFVVILPVVAIYLRWLETSDPEVTPPVDPELARRLAAIEDHDVSNQFSAFGTLKPGLFRRWLLVAILWVANWATRHVYTRGKLGRVHTIHAARWVFMDQRQRVFFGSNYDGGLESYMDDFINKVGWGLNLVFSNGIGYPSVRWLVLDGAKDEQKFKNYIRRHEAPTEVWYNGHAGFTAHEMQRHRRVRQGVEAVTLDPDTARAWCELL